MVDTDNKPKKMNENVNENKKWYWFNDNGGFKWIPYHNGKHGRRHDVWITINYNKWVVPNSSLCMCQFNTAMSWCFQDSKVILQQHYGPHFMTPMKLRNGTWIKRQDDKPHRLDWVNRHLWFQ